MATGVCGITTDLSAARLEAGGQSLTWSAPEIGEEARDSPAVWAGRARDAASWLARSPGRRRLGLVVLDADDTLCAWITARSGAAQVVQASWRSLVEDWGDAAVGVGVYPLFDPPAPESTTSRLLRRGKGEARSRGVHGGVLGVPDALPRLWLDALDKQGVRVGGVATLWHAMVLAWGDEADADDTHAVVMHDRPGRVVWAWGAGDDLIAGGVTGVPEGVPPGDEAGGDAPAEGVEDAALDSAAQRLTLDWLTWATQTGLRPGRVTVIGSASGSLGASIQRRWEEAVVETVEAADPLGETLSRAGDRWSRARDGRKRTRGLVPLMERPTRGRRRQFWLGAVALVALAAAAGGFGWRVQEASAAREALASDLRASTREMVASMDDPALAGPNPVKGLESKLVQLRQEPQAEPPPAPKPMFEETRRVIELVAGIEGVELVRLSLDADRQNTLSLNVPDRETSIRLEQQLRLPDFGVRWERQAAGGLDERILLRGTWK